jgi:hypothetical protein
LQEVFRSGFARVLLLELGSEGLECIDLRDGFAKSRKVTLSMCYLPQRDRIACTLVNPTRAAHASTVKPDASSNPEKVAAAQP